MRKNEAIVLKQLEDLITIGRGVRKDRWDCYRSEEFHSIFSYWVVRKVGPFGKINT